MNGEGEWFPPKRYGYGAGLPISWQGWAISIAYLALVAVTSMLIDYSWIAWVSIFAIITVAFVVIVARTTRGGWRWRWGEEE